MQQNVFGMVETPGSALTLNLREHFLPKKVHRMNKLCRIFGIFVIIALIFEIDTNFNHTFYGNEGG